jgi:hypothetical protein
MQISLVLWHVACSSAYTLKICKEYSIEELDFAEVLSRINCESGPRRRKHMLI